MKLLAVKFRDHVRTPGGQFETGFSMESTVHRTHLALELDTTLRCIRVIQITGQAEGQAVCVPMENVSYFRLQPVTAPAVSLKSK